MEAVRKEIHYSDHLEREVGELLNEIGISFIHESQNNGSNLDFYLPSYDVYIEVKQLHTEIVVHQLSKRDNVILIQGKKSIQFLKAIL
jgi:hypothetical protein